MTNDAEPVRARSSTRKLVWIVLAIFLVLVAGVALLAWVMGDTLLPMEYEGFD